MGVELLANGGRRVHFYVPQKLVGKQCASIDIAPCTLDHLLRWQQGLIESPLMLMAELTGMREVELRCLTFPDADRVLAAFLEVVPEIIRTDIAEGQKPLARALEAGEERPGPVPGIPEPAPRADEWPGAPAGEPSPAEAQQEAIRRATGEDDGGLDLTGDRT